MLHIGDGLAGAICGEMKEGWTDYLRLIHPIDWKPLFLSSTEYLIAS